MKTKILIICLLGAFSGLQNSVALAQQTKSYNTIIQYFIDSHINADSKKLNEILSDDATYKIPRQSKITVQSKSALLAAMRKDAGVKQNCTSSFELITSTDAFVLARVDFKYPEFTQQNFLTIEKDLEKTWKISMVYKLFVDDGPGSSAPSSTIN